MKSRLQRVIEDERLCRDRRREVLYCRAYEFDYCKKTCTYAKKMINPEESARAMEVKETMQLAMPNLNYAARVKKSRDKKL